MKSRSLGLCFLWMTGAATCAVGLLFGAIGWMFTRDHDLRVAQQQIAGQTRMLTTASQLNARVQSFQLQEQN